MKTITNTVVAIALSANTAFAHSTDNSTAQADFIAPTVANIQTAVAEFLPYIETNAKTWKLGERAGQSRLPVADVAMPSIVIMERDALQTLYVELAYEGEGGEGLGPDMTIPTIAAFYDHRNDTMYFHNEMNLANPYNRSTVLHELIHHVQYTVGFDKDVACDARMEEPAYTIQLNWLDEVGYNNDAKMTSLKWGKVMYSSCRVSRH
jgi:hypothetical protein